MISNSFKKYSAVIFIFVLPIILANQYYIDDIGRASFGYRKWGVDGRPVADMVMSLINLSSRMVDLAPLPILLSVAMLSISFSLYRKNFLDESRWSFIVPLAFLANPAIISVFSYRFDVFTFSCAIAAAFFIYSYRTNNFIINIVTGSILTTLVLSTYQAVINLVGLLFICELVTNIAKLQNPLKTIKVVLERACQVALGGIIYAKLILPNTFKGDHSSNHPGVSGDLLSAAKINAMKYYNFASNNFYKSHGEMFFNISAIACIVMVLFLSYRYAKMYRGNWQAWIVIAGSILASALALPMTMGALLILENALGGVHLYMAVGGFYLLLATLIFHTFRKYSFVSILIIIPLFYNLTLLFAYGNALQAQERINKVILSEISAAIHGQNDDKLSVIFTGTAPRSDIVKNASVNYPLIKYAVTDYFWNWYWASAYMSMNGIKQTYLPASKAAKYISEKCTYNISYENQWFIAYNKDEMNIIDFSKRKCN